MTDQIVLAELAVTGVSVAFIVWWYTPTQCRRRLRRDARARARLRRELSGSIAADRGRARCGHGR